MDEKIVNLVAEITFRTADHFNFDYDKALDAVAHSRIVNHMIDTENKENKTLDELCELVIDEIAYAR